LGEIEGEGDVFAAGEVGFAPTIISEGQGEGGRGDEPGMLEEEEEEIFEGRAVEIDGHGWWICLGWWLHFGRTGVTEKVRGKQENGLSWYIYTVHIYMALIERKNSMRMHGACLPAGQIFRQ
jgi:hypothetical protein